MIFLKDYSKMFFTLRIYFLLFDIDKIYYTMDSVCQKCDPQLTIFGAILENCWTCFKMYAEKDPETLHYTIRIPKKPYTARDYDTVNFYKVDIVDRHGNIVRQGERKYYYDPIVNIVIEEIDESGFISYFDYKSLKCILKSGASPTKRYGFIDLWRVLLLGMITSRDKIESIQYIKRGLKLLCVALDNGWYKPLTVKPVWHKPWTANPIYRSSWIVELIKNMYLMEGNTDLFRTLVWKLLDHGETFTEEHITYLRENINGDFYWSEQHRIFLEENRPNTSNKEIIEENIGTLRTFISEYYFQECMKESSP